MRNTDLRWSKKRQSTKDCPHWTVHIKKKKKLSSNLQKNWKIEMANGWDKYKLICGPPEGSS